MKKQSIPDIDKVLNAVKQKPATVKELAKAFSLKPEKVESWANLLEKKGLVSINYSMFGSPIIKIKDIKVKKKEEEDIKKEKNKKSRNSTPTRTLAIVFIFVIIFISAYYMGIFERTTNQSAPNNPGEHGNTNIPLFDPFDVDKQFSKTEDSATYTTLSEFGDYHVKNSVILKQGKIRVEWPESGKIIIYDGESKSIINKDGIVKPLDDITFDTEVSILMPWTYTDMMTGTAEQENITLSVNGLECTQILLPENESVCLSQSLGFPLKYESEGFVLTFDDIKINPTIDDSVFQTKNE